MSSDSLLNDQIEKTELLSRLYNHPSAPIWNHQAHDNLDQKNLENLRSFKSQLDSSIYNSNGFKPNSEIIAWTEHLRYQSAFFYQRLSDHENLLSQWFDIETMSREDIVKSLEDIIPSDAPFDELRFYRTTGTTGHPVSVPHAKFSVSCYQVFIEHALNAAGIYCDFQEDKVACFLIGAQEKTVTYATTLSYWNNSAFVKMNIDYAQWKDPQDPALYLNEFNPQIITGNPISFSKLLELDTKITPRVLITTAVALSDGLKNKLIEKFRCPVIDWYSLTETGPIAFKAPENTFYQVICPDMFIECLDSNGLPVLPGNIGEITVTGGRNPFLPLLRYRTGDFGRLIESDNGQRLISDLEGRNPVQFRKADGSKIHSVDLAGCIRPFPIVQYEFSQKNDFSCELTLRMLSESDKNILDQIHSNLGNLFGNKELITIKVDPELGKRNPGGKVIPYHSEFIFEE